MSYIENMQKHSLFFILLHQSSQFILHICIQGKYILQFIFRNWRRTVLMLFCFNFYLFKSLDALLSFDIDIYSYHLVSENDTKSVSFYPRRVRSGIGWTHSYLLDYLWLDVKFNLWWIHFRQTERQPQADVFILIVLYFWKYRTESISEWKGSQIKGFLSRKISKK